MWFFELDFIALGLEAIVYVMVRMVKELLNHKRIGHFKKILGNNWIVESSSTTSEDDRAKLSSLVVLNTC